MSHGWSRECYIEITRQAETNEASVPSSRGLLSPRLAGGRQLAPSAQGMRKVKL